MKKLIIALISITLISCKTIKKEQTMNTNKKLIYIMDAQCGWCYGNAENITTIYNEYKNKFDFEFLNGGMWIGENAPQAGEKVNNYIGTHLPRLVDYTGVKISDEYKELIANSDYVLSSLEPSAAIVLLKKLVPEKAFEIAKEVQNIYFTQGKRLDKLATYLPILEQYGIAKSDFEKAWLSEENLKETYQEFNRVSGLVRGFPTLFLQEDDKTTVLASGYFQLATMQTKLDEILKQNNQVESVNSENSCTDTCVK